MLVLTRCTEERIQIRVPPSKEEQTIDLLVVQIRPLTVRLGIQADKSIEILRQEVAERIAQEIEICEQSPVRLWQ